jgi:hypothetical protein
MDEFVKGPDLNHFRESMNLQLLNMLEVDSSVGMILNGIRVPARTKSLSLTCPLAHLLCYIYRHISRYAPADVPRR